MSARRPQTLAGAVLELHAAALYFYAQLAYTMGLRSTAVTLARASARKRLEWRRLERDL